ncbi:MAG: amidohydrolase family protein [Thermodesulfobacteriota bacterium]
MIIDFHTHAFPDRIAERAVPALAEEGKIPAHTDGTVDGLLRSMDMAGIEKSVICSIATRPEQFSAIFDWSKKIRSKRLTPLLSIHPEDPNPAEKVQVVADHGFAGIKLHPYYQDFYLDEDRLDPLYQSLSDHGLLLVSHCGYDIAFPRERRADPARILTVMARFPDLKLITTHFGGWDIWDEVEESLLGREIYMEISFALSYLSREKAVDMIGKHPADYLLFGSDSPWEDQLAAVNQLKGLGLTENLLKKILGRNGARLL